MQNGQLLLQLSDPHLFAGGAAHLQGVNTEQAFQAVLKHALETHPGATALVVTGDLVHDESPAGYQRLANILTDVPLPVHLIPGNHDDPALLHTIAGGNLHTGPVADYADWRIVLLNSRLPGSAGGHLGARELDNLKQALATAADRHVLIALHHNPVATGSAWLDTMTLDNADALFRLIDQYPRARAMIWGHVHQSQQGQRHGVSLLGCPATCFQFRPASRDFALDDAAPGYRWLNLLPDGNIETGINRVGTSQVSKSNKTYPPQNPSVINTTS